MVSVIKQNFDNRYEIRDQVGAGGMGQVYSAHDRLTGDMVALKNVKPDFQPRIKETTASIADFRVALAQEFSVLATLRHPNIISVLDYGFDLNKQPYFTMSLLNQPKTIVEYAKNLTAAKKIELIIQMLEAIDYLHRRGVIHRDLKPENVIIENGRVKVLDFGVARLQYQAIAEPEGMLVGTLAYMAPEVFAEDYNDNLARLSDIYAAGLIVYEIFTDVFPYDTSNVGVLIQQIAGYIPDFSLLETLDTDLNTDKISFTAARMLEKSPLDRYLSIDDVLIAFYNILGRQRETNIEVRESLLQTVRMVGRETELKQLDEALKLTSAEQGSMWLIGGETGVGKSRLVDELRIRALVRGALVVRGQCITEANAPYQLWRDVLSRIILEVPLEPLEASVLKPLVDNIERLIGVEHVPDAPEIGAVESYNRLMTVVSQVLTRLNRELLIILEDLHWARESLNLLKQVIPLVQNNTMMIVGTFRNDERPNLPQELSGVQVLPLENLSKSAVSAYAESVVGFNQGLPQIIDLLQTETKGNVMFMIEFLRAIIEEFQALDNFKLEKVSQDMLGGGVQRVIRYRLRDMPAKFYEMLRMAAVLGRVINLDVMNQLYGDELVKAWLLYSEEMMLLRIRNDQWRISNNTIRETVLEDIDAADLIAFHMQAAETIEALDGEDVGAVRLAYHWEEAGDVSKEAHYKAIAAEQVYESSAFQDAAEYLERLLILHQEHQIEADDLTLARFHRMLGTCYVEIGKIPEAMDNLMATVGILRFPVPRSQVVQGLAMLGEVMRQVWHRFSPIDLVKKSGDKRNKITEAALALNQIAEVTLAYQPEPILSIYSSLRVLNLSELLGRGYSLTYSYAGVALLVSSIGRRDWAKTYLKLAHEMLSHDDLSRSTVAVSTFPMSIVYASWGEWKQARTLLKECLDTSDEIGDWKSWRQASGLGGDIHHYLGEYEAAIKQYIDAYTSTERMNHVSQMAIQMAIRSRTLFLVGRYEEARAAADDALGLDDAPMVTLNAMSVHVLNALRLGDWDELQTQLNALSEHIANNPFKIYVQFDGYAAAAEARIALLAHEATDETRQKAQDACKDLLAFGKTYPIAEARAKIFEARRLYLNSDVSKAIQLAEEGLAIASHLKMPYDEGLAHMVLGRINSDDAQIQKAREIFESINNTWGLHQLDTLDI